MTLKVKWGYISGEKIEVSVKKVLLCLFHCKPRTSGVSLEYAEVENIPPVPGNRAQVGQNHDARKAVSATLSVLNLRGTIFRPRSSRPGVQLFLPWFSVKRTKEK